MWYRSVCGENRLIPWIDAYFATPRWRTLPTLLAGAWLAGMTVIGCVANEPAGIDPDAPRSEAWAEPLPDPAVPNLHRVNAGLYRGGQPDADGMQRLYELGVKTVLNLRDSHSDADAIGATPLRLVEVDMEAYDIDDDELLAALRVMVDPGAQPVYVHCQHGADRTGAAVAAYRIIVEGWTTKEAVDELVYGDYGYHYVFTNIPVVVRNLDVPAYRAALGIPDE